MSTSPVTAGKLGYDLLMGDIRYAPCGHTFSYALDHSLERTGARSAHGHPCPRCTQPGGSCLICLSPWSPDRTDACACGMYFAREARDARRAGFQGQGLDVGTDTRRFAAQRRVARRDRTVRKERFLSLAARKKTGAEKAADDGAAEAKPAGGFPAEDKMAEGHATEERPIDGRKGLE